MHTTIKKGAALALTLLLLAGERDAPKGKDRPKYPGEALPVEISPE